MLYSAALSAATTAALLSCASAFSPLLTLSSGQAQCHLPTASSTWVGGPAAALISPSPSRRPRSAVGLRMEIDNSVVIGAAAAIAGLGLGIGLVAFTEKQGERTAERGGISEEMANKFTAKFMEDEVMMENTDVTDVRARMREALGQDQTEEEAEASKNAAIARARAAEEDDGW